MAKQEKIVTIDTIIVNLLSMSKELRNTHTLWSAWLGCVAGALYLEQLFKDSFDLVTGLSKKEVFANIGELQTIPINGWTKENALKWCSQTYDPNHKLRFAVETLDSIEEVRVYLEPLRDKDISLRNLLELKYKRKWRVRN